MMEKREHSLLVQVNPVAKIYANLPGVTDLMALEMAARTDDHVKKAETVVKPIPQGTSSTKPNIELTDDQRYGDIKHAQRYGDWESARRMEKDKRMHWKND